MSLWILNIHLSLYTRFIALLTTSAGINRILPFRTELSLTSLTSERNRWTISNFPSFHWEFQKGIYVVSGATLDRYYLLIIIRPISIKTRFILRFTGNFKIWKVKLFESVLENCSLNLMLVTIRSVFPHLREILRRCYCSNRSCSINHRLGFNNIGDWRMCGVRGSETCLWFMRSISEGVSDCSIRENNSGLYMKWGIILPLEGQPKTALP